MSSFTRGQRFFGTDGVRGRANTWPVMPDVIMKLAMAAGSQFIRGVHHHTVIIGKDTRLSGYMIESALTAGFVAMGMDVILLGPIPTPAVGMLTRSLRADLGVMISASHNPYYDNGVKFFGPHGYKLQDVQESAMEALLNQGTFNLASPQDMGKARRLEDAPGRYMEFIKSSFPRALRLEGLKIVVDCAHGAAYKIAPAIFWELGADIIPLGVVPDGANINVECGATALGAVQQAVQEHQADLGIALDGDADRLILVDEKGHILDGDQLMALITKTWFESGQLTGGGLVATHMSNLGLERYLQVQGLKLIRTAVGDRYVIEAMQQYNCNVGGEQSGHIILRDYSTTGDGLIAALQVLKVIVMQDQSASQVGRLFEPVPQVLKSIRTTNYNMLSHELVQKAIKVAEKALMPHGQLVIRYSGTEPLIRIMAQGDEEPLLHKAINIVMEAVETAEKKAA